MNIIWVMIGGALGSGLRWWFSQFSNNHFPWGTLLANCLSCFVLGYLMAYHSKAGLLPHYKLLLATGFCGGFSTFSTFSFEGFSFLKSGNFLFFISYSLASILLGLFFISLGWYTSK